MAAITPSSISADTVHGQQFFDGGSILVLPFTLSTTLDTWQAPKGMNPVAVAWQPTTTNDAVSVTMSAAKVVTFASVGGSESGNLILVIGGGA